MPADFLTKWIPAAKFATSIAYVTNSRALGAFQPPFSTDRYLGAPSPERGEC